MKIAGSFLQIQDDKKRIKWLNDVCDFIHYDIMDGLFTDKATIANDLLLENTACVTKGKDVHLMVLDVKKYADIYSKVNPDIIIFHYEATSDIMENIMYIKNKGIGVGLAINPETDVRVLDNYLNKLDMVLVMSVQAGASGQTFIDITDKIDYLIKYRYENNLEFIIQVDGGINDKTINKVKNADRVVVGSFITKSDDYLSQVNKLR